MLSQLEIVEAEALKIVDRGTRSFGGSIARES